MKRLTIVGFVSSVGVGLLLAPVAGIGGPSGPPAGLNVNVINTPNVKVTNTVPVMNVENPDELPVVRFDVAVTLPPGGNSTNTASVGPPEGKRWVIEQVSALASMPVGQWPILSVFLAETGTPTLHWMAFSPQGDKYYVVSQPLKLRLSAGERIQFSFQRTSTDGQGTLHVYGTGYEIDQP